MVQLKFREEPIDACISETLKWRRGHGIPPILDSKLEPATNGSLEDLGLRTE